MKSFEIRTIEKKTALEMIKKYHYSNTLPKLNKFYLGFFQDDMICGVVTLGWGTRPLHTIRRIFPELGTNDYLEIGRMCLIPSMPKNSASHLLSLLTVWLKNNHPEVKVLFTWADGMLGKPGYIYQASNFYYAGFSIGEFYMKDGIKMHPRQMKGILYPNGTEDARVGTRPTLEQMKKYGIDHYKGKQFRYFLFLCNKKEKKRLLKECACKNDLELPVPKAEDITWTKRNVDSGKWEKCGKPPYVTDFDCKTKDIVDIGLDE